MDPAGTAPTPRRSGDEIRSARNRIEAHPFWYHTIDVFPGVTTPGWFDLRPTVDRMPWPEIAGKRCLDIGTFDGFLAFEMERRGAAEVVAVDIEDHREWDWPVDVQVRRLADAAAAGDVDVAFTGPPKGAGFRLLSELMGSTVTWLARSIYDLDPADVGQFDVVVCGTLLLHLRDPLRALAAVRDVCAGVFLSAEEIDPWLTVAGKGRPLARLNGVGRDCQWWVPNAAGHHRMIMAGGFEVERWTKPYTVAFNHHPRPPVTGANLAQTALRRVLTGSGAPGVLHRAVLARPQR